MEFIDTHQHLIYRNRFGYSWTEEIPTLASGDFTLDDYTSLTGGKGVVGTVFMEAGVDDADYKAEARYVATLVGSQKLLGQIASCRPEESVGFDAWLEESRELDVVGFRRILHVMPDSLSQSSMFHTNIRKIGDAGLPFDLCVLARQLPIAEDLIRKCPDQAFILDHCGVPDIAAGAFDEWACGLDAISAHPNVNVKLSGIAAYCAPGEANIETLRPWFDRVLEQFGPKRILWGSDWPVVNLGNGLPNWLEMTHQLISDLSLTEQTDIAVSNAKSVYAV